MRILILTTGCFDKGGVSRFTRYQASALRQLYGDSEVRVLSLLGPDEHAIEEPFTTSWHGHRFGLVDKVRMSGQAVRHAVAWKPDVILAAHLSLGYLAYLLSKVIGSVSVLNIYGLEVWSNPRATALRALAKVDHVIADCLSTAEYVTENNLRSKPIIKIWDCVDTDRFQPGDCPKEVLRQYRLPDPQQHFVVMTLGRIAKAATHKGYHRLMQVFARLAATVPSARLVICGRGDMLDELKAFSAELEIEELVHFTGAIDEQHLPLIYRAASVFSLVSEKGEGRGEGIPMTPMEAMACGVPIIAGNQDGSRELIVGENGFVIEPFDLDAHLAHLREFCTESGKLQKMSAIARQVAGDVFSYDRFVREHRDLFDQLGKI